MKKLLFVAVALLASLNAGAQIDEDNWYITPKVGVGITDLTGNLFSRTKMENSYDSKLTSLTGFTCGVEFEYGLADQVGLSFGLNYARQGGKTSDDLFKVSLDYVNIPFTLNYYPIPEAGLAIKAGVQVGFTTRKRMTIDGVEYNADYNLERRFNRWGRPILVYVESELSRKFNKVDCSIPLAVSYEYKRFMIEARYNLGLTNVMKNDPENSKNSVWLFTVGYKIPMGDD